MLGTNLPNGAGISGQEVRRRKKERESKRRREKVGKKDEWGGKKIWVYKGLKNTADKGGDDSRLSEIQKAEKDAVGKTSLCYVKHDVWSRMSRPAAFILTLSVGRMASIHTHSYSGFILKQFKDLFFYAVGEYEAWTCDLLLYCKWVNSMSTSVTPAGLTVFVIGLLFTKDPPECEFYFNKYSIIQYY